MIKVLLFSLFLCSTACAQSLAPSPPAQVAVPAPPSIPLGGGASPATADGLREADLSSRVRPPAYPDPVFGYVVTGIIALAIAVACGLIRKALEGSNWSLSDALSEEISVTPTKADGTPLDGVVNPPVVSKLSASTSRFIAMFGLISILILYIGFGLVILNAYAATGGLPSPDDVGTIIKFVAAGGTLFAPYLINKISSMFDWLSPKQ